MYKMIKTASYHEASDFFTKDELVEFCNEVEDVVNEKLHFQGKSKMRTSDSWIEGRNLHITLENDEYSASTDITIDMRSIRRPSDLLKYVDSASNAIVEQMQGYVNDDSDIMSADELENSERRWLEPEDSKEPINQDESTELVEVEIDQLIRVRPNGSYSFIDDDTDWASSDDHGDSWYSEDMIYLDDPSGVADKIEDLIEPNVPMKPGTYRVTGIANLIYIVSGIQEYRTYYGEDDYDSDIDTDFADSRYSFRDSSVENLKILPDKS